jgi:holo-[acyl-carrier protein] synthase
MILGTGIDTVEIIRFQKFLDDDNQPLLKRLFSEAEKNHCYPKKQAASCLAARFAAKEAFVKAMGTGLRDGMCWTEIEVVNDPLGKPSLRFSGYTQQLLAERGTTTVHLSLSHDGGHAVALVILEAL